MLCLCLGLLFGGPSGCVTQAVLEAIWEIDDEEDPTDPELSPVSSRSWASVFFGRLGLTVLVLPGTLSLDFLIGIPFGLLDDDDDDDDDDEGC